MADDKSGNGEDKSPDASPELEAARRSLRVFLGDNPISTIEETDGEEGKRLRVENPWGEDAIVINLPDDLGPMAEALNNLYLPERFTAVWHKDKNEFEVVWTAFPLPESYDDFKARKFCFQFDGVEHECEFGRSSDRLLLIAEHSATVGISETGHRNLPSFRRYVRWQKATDKSDTGAKIIGEPLSFWIRNLEWDDDRISRLVHHLNFYMTYYDNKTPSIFIHASKAEEAKPRTRYLFDVFPKKIDGREIEIDLLNLWAASQSGDAGRRFVYCYRILEYAAYAYVERDVRLQVRRLLSSSHARDDIAGLADQVIAATLSSKVEDIQRIDMLLRDTVDSKLLWKEIDQNRESFIGDITFDGGFKMAALIAEGETHGTFATSGISRFAHAARQIRNNLSHGREKTTQASISPTVANFRKLAPWASAISVVAGEVINFKYIL